MNMLQKAIDEELIQLFKENIQIALEYQCPGHCT